MKARDFMTKEELKLKSAYDNHGDRSPEATAAVAKYRRLKRQIDPWARAKNKALVSYNSAKNIAKKYGCIIATDPKEIKAMKEFYLAVALLNQRDGGRKWSVDHIVELAMGGPHTLANLQCITVSENIKKSHRLNPRKNARKGEKGVNTIAPPLVEIRDAN